MPPHPHWYCLCLLHYHIVLSAKNWKVIKLDKATALCSRLWVADPSYNWNWPYKESRVMTPKGLRRTRDAVPYERRGDDAWKMRGSNHDNWGDNPGRRDCEVHVYARSTALEADGVKGNRSHDTLKTKEHLIRQGLNSVRWGKAGKLLRYLGMRCGPRLHCWKDNWLNKEHSSDGMKNLHETRRCSDQAVAVRWRTGLTECANVDAWWEEKGARMVTQYEMGGRCGSRCLQGFSPGK